MSLRALWLYMVLLIGSVSAADVPFVFDQSTSGVTGYTSAQIEQGHISSLELAGVPVVSSPSDSEFLEIPIAGGGNSSGTQKKNIGELKRTLDARVEPDNPRVRDEAVVLALKYPGENTIVQVVSIYDYLKNGDGEKKGWGYVSDPRGMDDFMFANQTIRNGERADYVGGGDCDDFAILMAALVESIGGTTRIILARNNSTGGHAYAEVYLGKLNDTNSQVETIIDWLREKFDTGKIYTHIDTGTKDVWLNLDWGEDEKGSAHPGGPFYQGDMHIVLFIRDALAKTPLRLPEKSNKPPKLISFAPDKSTPQNPGTIINWTIEAKDPEGDKILYQFLLNDEPVTKWLSENRWIWTTSIYDIGENRIEARVRDGKHAGSDSSDSNKVASFGIVEPSEIAPTPMSTSHKAANEIKDETDTGNLLFSDFFTDSNSGWGTILTDSQYKIYYDDGSLHFNLIKADDQMYFSDQTIFIPPRDFVIEADATQESSGDLNQCCISFRVVNYYNRYYFLISENGLYKFGKLIDNEFKDIIPWTTSLLINKGMATNKMKIKAEGSSFTFYVNGREIASCVDSTFPEGGIALCASSSEEDNTFFSFDNLKVWSVDS